MKTVRIVGINWIGIVIMMAIAQSMVSAQRFELSDIPVEIDGSELAYPFAGGMATPQFSEVDLDMDGSLDLVVFDRVGDIFTTYLFDQTSTTYYTYAPQYVDQLPKLKDWALFIDYNGDDIPDIFTGSAIPTFFGIQIYRGRWDGMRLIFDLVELSQGPENIVYFEDENFNSVQLQVLSSDLPAIADIDGDGDVDILNFDGSGGFVEYIQNMSVERGLGLENFFFKRGDRCWGKFFESGTSDATISLSSDPNNCFSGVDGGLIASRHAGSSITAFDADEDGLMDVLIGDISNDRMVFLKNTGSTSNAFMSSVDNAYPSSTTPIDIFTFPAAFIIDVNHDGLMDIIAAPNEKQRGENRKMNHLYLNEGTGEDPSFVKESEDFLVREMIDLSTGSRPAIFDYNADGLPDIVVGTFGSLDENGIQRAQLFLFENVGTTSAPSFKLIDEDYLNFQQFGELNIYLTPTFGDLDGDGDQDLIMGTISGRLIYFLNKAAAGQPALFGPPQFNYQEIDVGSHANPSIIDIDNDGLMDLVIGEENGNNNSDNTGKCSHFTYFRNIGSVGNPLFDPVLNSNNNIACFGNTLVENPSQGKGYSSPSFLSSGDNLILVSGSRTGGVKIYTDIREQVNDTFTLVDERFGEVDLGERSHPILWDLNNDGLLELIGGNLRGGLRIYDTDISLNELVATRNPINEIPVVIYPNPTVDQLLVRRDGHPTVYYHIVDISGTIVRAGRLQSSSIIDVSILSRGMYTIRVTIGEQVGVSKFVKIK